MFSGFKVSVCYSIDGWYNYVVMFYLIGMLFLFLFRFYCFVFWMLFHKKLVHPTSRKHLIFTRSFIEE